MKKVVKILGIVIVLIITAIFIIPIVFEGKIIEMVKTTANNNLKATLDFEDADLSIWSSFPSAEVSLHKISLINKAPFEGDTLFYADQIDLKLPLGQLFKGGSDISITSFAIDKANLAIKIDENGNANYDIAKESDADIAEETELESEPLQLNLDNYSITNSKISYIDATSKMGFLLKEFNHKGEGNLSSVTSKLNTKTNGLVTFEMDSVAYLNNNVIDLEAIIGIDLNENKFSFLENKALINQLPLVFDGFVKINENNQEVAINFKTPSSDFKNFLALIPEVYSKNIEGVTTTGNFDITGKFEGVVDETHIPKFNIIINSDNASFKYPDLPKSLENINLNTKIANETGLVKDTYVAIDTLSFRLEQETFNASANLTEVTENMKVSAHLDGKINLANLEQVYPADAVKDLKGNLSINASTAFDMNSIEKGNYENTRTSGTFILQNFEYVSNELSDKLIIDKTSLSLNPKVVKLNSFAAKLGKTDIQASGRIDNLLGFFFNKEDMKGQFSLNSNTFSVDDFMVAEVDSKEKEEKSDNVEAQEESIKIPSFLDCTVEANATTVLYDNITLKNVSGTLLIKDQTATLKNMKSSIFNGTIGFDGNVSTKSETPTFAMNLDMNSLNIDESFKQLSLLEALAPIAKVIQGKLNTNISLSGSLNNDFTPNLNTVSGNAMAELIGSKLSPENSPLIQKLESQLTFLDSKKLDLSDLKTALTFKDGKVQINPFSINYEDIKVDISGGHGFDNTLGYDAVVNVPAKYLGSDVTKLLAQLDEKDSENIQIPVNAIISGSFTNPSIKTDLKSAVTNLTNQLVTQQKNKLIDKGKEKVEDALKDLLGNKETAKDTTSSVAAKDSVKNSNTKPTVEDVAKDALKNLFGKKKEEKDTVN
ncbi:AsmA family protein [Aureibaculum marinum]|uniref:AsmA family protein n=1 Tax=Aureibaculum marinum TaxID=2487930 RepID=A0A3N4NJ81_9FLAO|nr:AsmA-like C-terminal region-containing protein [Aureibaculum marinum]RPD96462.1 AsmA family protein [Aureibaculum marinum]